MRIVIDMQGAQSASRFRGIGRYTMSFAQAVVRNRGEHEVILALSGLSPDTIEPIRAAFDALLPQENIRVWHAPGPVREEQPGNESRRKVAELIREAFLASLQPDVVHISSLFEGYVDDAVTSIGRFDNSTPVSVILYDLIPLLNPEHYLKHNPHYEKYYLRKVEYLRCAKKFLAISDFSRKEGLEALDVSGDTIVSISTAIDDYFLPQNIDEATASQLNQKFGICRPFVLYTGGADERKNLPRLIRAYASLPPVLRSQYQLLFAGKMPEGDVVSFKQVTKSVGLKVDELLFTGYVSNNELVQLYNLCKLYVFPSWHEGFGLPALEAMACGAPVIGANTSSLPEVIGLDEALFDPLDVKAITAKMKQALEDEAFRLRLVEHGLQQAEKFSWDTTAQKAIEAWEALLPNKEITKLNSNGIRQHNSKVYRRLVMDIAKTSITRKLSIASAEIQQIALSIERNEEQCRMDITLPNHLTWRIEGPFDSSYSLALVNRELARALSRSGHTVVLHSTEGPGDFLPDDNFLSANTDLAEMYERSFSMDQRSCDVTSRNLYPPRVDDMECNINFLHSYGWEETGFPYEWVQSFNKNLSGLTVMSAHVKKTLIDNGVTVPIAVAGIGASHGEGFTCDPDYVIKAKKFRFLHVSSCFPRKGVEVLLEAFGQVFNANDDVSLVIKTFPNPHNNIQQELADLKRENNTYPHVVLIQDDLSECQLKALYEQCHVLVAPSFAEGYGLPLAEAMLSGLPVITTNWSGQIDFCNYDNSWLVDYEFERAKTHFGLYASVWAKPKTAELANAMSEAFSASEDERKARAQLGRNLLMQNHSWRDVAKRSENFVRAINEEGYAKVYPKVGWITTWNSKCGIATYSQHLSLHFPQERLLVFAPQNESVLAEDDVSCIRGWRVGKDENSFHELNSLIDHNGIDCIVIQFNYGFFNHRELSDFIHENHSKGRVIVMMMHSTVDPKDKGPDWNFQLGMISESLKICDRILVHTVHDLNRLKDIGVYKNTTLFPHGVLDYGTQENGAQTERSNKIQTVASYGFCLPHKGLKELVEATELLKRSGYPIHLLLLNAEHPAPESTALVAELKKLITSKGLSAKVTMINDFLPDQESLKYLAMADLIVFAYQNTEESASGAVKYGMATGNHVAVTPIPIFEDMRGAVFQLPGTSIDLIAEGIKSVLDEIKSKSEKSKVLGIAAEQWRTQHSYSLLSKRLYNICTALYRDKSKG